MLRAAVAVGIGAVIAVSTAAPARADIGGSVPSPGDCTYPSVGTFGAAFGEYDSACQFPVEENGSRHTTLYGGGMWQVTGTLGISFMIFNASISASVPTGVLRGISYWACPDFSVSEPPNPPGAWKNYLKPKPCKSIAPRPELIREMPSPPPGVPAPPPPPQPEIAPPPPTGDTSNAATGAVTDPGQGNPAATDNSR